MVHHSRGLTALLRQAGRSADEAEEFVRAIASGDWQALVSARERALLDYALILTAKPTAVTASDVERLRQHGCDDHAIHDLCAIVAYYNFVNRIADGLGVELEPPLAG